jgi:hypothetical protein
LMLKAETITAGQNGVTCLDQSADLTSYDWSKSWEKKKAALGYSNLLLKMLR